MKYLHNIFIALLLCAAGLYTASCVDAVLPETDAIPDTEKEESSEEGIEEKDEEIEREEEEHSKGGEFVLLFTNDFHSQVEPIDRRDAYNPDMGGAARLKALVDSVRTAEPAVLLTDSGDMVEGTFYFNLYSGEVEMMILDEIGYHVRTIGNHDLSKKVIGLNEMFSMCKVPVVCSNYDFSNSIAAGHAEKSMIFKVGNVKVGVIGLNVKLEGLVDPEAYEGISWKHAITEADTEAEKLRLKGADIIVALSHIGLYDSYNDDISIAMYTRHIDVILSGHTHSTALPEGMYVTNLDGKKVLIGHTGSNGKYLGYAKIKISEDGVPSYQCRLIPVDRRLDNRLDQNFVSRIESYCEGTGMNDIIGECPYMMYKYSGLDYPLGNMSADALIWMAKKYHGVDADVSFYNTGGVRNPIFAGECRVKDIYFSFPFDNLLTTFTITGEELFNVFSKLASSKGLLVNGDVRLVISGNSIKSLTIKGEELDRSKVYTVATINYVANLSKNGMSHLEKRESEEPITRYFVEYFKHYAQQNGGKISYQSDGRVVIE